MFAWRIWSVLFFFKSVYGILHARTLELVAISSCRGSCWPRTEPMSLTSASLEGSFPDSSVGKESTCNAGDPSSISESGRSPGEGIGYPLRFLWFPLWPSWWWIHLQCRRPGFNSWVGKISWRKERLPITVFWTGEFHGLYSPHGHRVRPNWATFTFFTPAPLGKPPSS